MAVRQYPQSADIPAICRLCATRRSGLCGALDVRQLAEVAKASSRLEVPSGPELSDRETYSNILSGVVKLTRNLSNCRRQIVGLHFAPDFLGRPCEPRTLVRAQTVTEVALCSFPRSIIDQMVQESPRLGSWMLEHALDQLDEARDWITALGRKTASERVASFLLMIARNVDPAERSAASASFELPLPRADIADFLGMTIETVSRELTRLRMDGVIGIVKKRHISLKDIGRLKDQCGD